ncbi:hypothetical protein CEXT_95871 [Caerostris extrusa]|uniref:Uncharacterized protein n=1 Tax=Caerostris extrusa TaxID=172846 RepID=A0AAV4RCC1_CAEEX|nr:hypothetical protein CEXT_95871 [Caerostris extrusa]
MKSEIHLQTDSRNFECHLWRNYYHPRFTIRDDEGSNLKPMFQTTAPISIAIFGGTTTSRNSQLGTTRVGRRTFEINLQTRSRLQRIRREQIHFQVLLLFETFPVSAGVMRIVMIVGILCKFKCTVLVCHFIGEKAEEGFRVVPTRLDCRVLPRFHSGLVRS